MIEIHCPNCYPDEEKTRIVYECNNVLYFRCDNCGKCHKITIEPFATEQEIIITEVDHVKEQFKKLLNAIIDNKGREK